MAPNPMSPSPSPTPQISLLTLPITGLLLDIYGLSELSPTATRITCLWLHHPRTRRRQDMAAFACRAVTAYNSSPAHYGSGRGLIALAFDQRNHGSRTVDERANAAWREGNGRHAQDMFGVVAGTVADQGVLIDALGGYLFVDEEEEGKRREIDRHLVLGVSLGGHSVWQTMFADERVRAGIAVIGCPDFEYLMRDRARLSRLPTYSVEDEGASFPGSKDFPPALVEVCKKLDPKAILFGTSAVPAPGTTSEAEKLRLRKVLDEKVRGKKFLVCSGGDDKLVPYRCSEPFMDWFEDAARTWYADGDMYVENKVYPGIGHMLSEEMVGDAIRFLMDVVGSDESPDSRGGEGAHKTSKI